MNSRVINYSGRSSFIQIIFLIGFVSLIIRLIYIQVFQDEFIKRQMDSKTTLQSSILAKRGQIVDRNERLLALDIKGYTVIADLNLFKPNQSEIKLLNSYLNLSKDKLNKLLIKKRGHVELIRHIGEEKKINLERINLKGIFFKENLQRTYPQLEISSHVVGITDIDRNGIQGTELVFNKMLLGENGGFSGVRSPIGVIGGNRRAPKEGSNLKLTIDIRLQSIAHHELKKAIEESGAESGSIVIINPNTAEILALNNHPTFNPSYRKGIKDLSIFRNRATIDVFEPGSVLKPIAMAAILSSGEVEQDVRVNTSPGWIQYGGYKTSDFRDYGKLSLSEIISYSSNVGMVKLCKDQESQHLINMFSSFGIGSQPVNILLPAREGFLPSASSLSNRDKVSSCYGYGISMSALQIAQAYQVFANKGVFKELNLFFDKELTSPKPEVKVLSEKTTSLINSMLIKTVNSKTGTARKARIEGRQVAGKTGTSEKKRNGEVSYSASFAGFVPAKDPSLLAVIVLHGLVKENHSGGSIAAPIFSKVVKQSIHALESGS
ncbi:MAG: hypothetical protein CMD90_03895 [Gammaproteobacteria bacterium]|nr:hypothetical protein [Gammaproteobacteria bacterium]